MNLHCGIKLSFCFVLNLLFNIYPKIVIKEYIMTIRLRKSIQFKEL